MQLFSRSLSVTGQASRWLNLSGSAKYQILPERRTLVGVSPGRCGGSLSLEIVAVIGGRSRRWVNSGWFGDLGGCGGVSQVQGQRLHRVFNVWVAAVAASRCFGSGWAGWPGSFEKVAFAGWWL